MIRARERDIGARDAFAVQQATLDKARLVVLDESSTHSAFTSRYGWAETTQRAYGDAPAITGRT